MRAPTRTLSQWNEILSRYHSLPNPRPSVREFVKNVNEQLPPGVQRWNARVVANRISRIRQRSTAEQHLADLQKQSDIATRSGGPRLRWTSSTLEPSAQSAQIPLRPEQFADEPAIVAHLREEWLERSFEDDTRGDVLAKSIGAALKGGVEANLDILSDEDAELSDKAAEMLLSADHAARSNAAKLADLMGLNTRAAVGAYRNGCRTRRHQHHLGVVTTAGYGVRYGSTRRVFV